MARRIAQIAAFTGEIKNYQYFPKASTFTNNNLPVATRKSHPERLGKFPRKNWWLSNLLVNFQVYIHQIH